MFSSFFKGNGQGSDSQGSEQPGKDSPEASKQAAKILREHAEIARSALEARDLRRSIYHLSLALAGDPLRDEWLVLLDKWIAAAGPDALGLVPLVGKSSHANAAIHAYIHASQGKIKAAADLFLQLLQGKPEIPYVLWLLRWQDQPGFIDALGSEKIVSIVAHLMRKYSGTYVFSERGRAEINLYLPLLRNGYTTFSNGPMSESTQTITFIYVMALRKIGMFEEAVRVARALPVTSYQTQVALAMAESAAGNLDAGIAAYRLALTLRPDDVAVRNDLGSLFLKQGQLTGALAFYEESFRLDPVEPYQLSLAYTAYLHYLREPSSEEWLEKLRTLGRTQSAARWLVSFLEFPYIGILPSPGEALINLMRDIKAKSTAGEINWKLGSTFKVGLSTLEAPSARLAVERMLGAQGVSCEMSVAGALTPDPRQPLRPVEHQIWRYEGMSPIPAVALPDPSIAESIGALARTPYALERWHSLARPLGQRLGPGALMSLFGVMVHPPTTPAGWDEWDWLFAIQIASALTIAALETNWEGSRRQAALISLIYGPMDWSGAAALIALAIIAQQDMRIQIEFDRICCDLWRFGPGSNEWPLEHAMVFGLLFLGSCSEEAQKHINAYLEKVRVEE